MTHAVIYHNPRCSKSRQTLALLEEKGCDITVVEYLKDAPGRDEIHQLMAQLGLTDPRDMMRTKEEEYRQLGLAALQGEALIQAMVTTPKLIERPIVVIGERAVFGRPPENVLELI
ncbi:arsenate reductase (glutaredoxin) [Shewanella sp. GXUN23E]|uniref:arsenate reductase (glutaredoxin) n=1 Tax=Shewanella sp. GXUN23E TaxID=3422498 RepID=UPI003D7D0AEA